MIALVALAMVAALLPFDSRGADAAEGDLFPWQLPSGTPEGVSPIGVGMSVVPGDLTFILQQIKIAEFHMGPTFDANDPCGNLIGTDPNQIPAGLNQEVAPLGLRTLNGICNNLVPGQEKFGATGEPFLRLTTAAWRPAQAGNPPALPPLPSTYDPTAVNPYGVVFDNQPRDISNLVNDQTDCNAAAVAAAGAPDPVVCTPGVSLDIENVAPDEGLSAPFNSMFTFFGQFFDHGLDLTTKTGETVYMPLRADDPLHFPPHPPIPPGMDFMVISRAVVAPGAVEPVNQTSPFVDQNQTYTSHPSQQVFQREYDFSGGAPVDTGRLLVSTPGADEGLATWADVKAQALAMGFVLNDFDVHNVPLMAADFYGNFIPGPSGFPQMVFMGPDDTLGTPDDFLVEGNPAGLVPTNGGPGAMPGRTGHGWLVDIAHHAAPGECDPDGPGPTLPIMQVPDADPGTTDDGDCLTYDDEMLDAHFVCGDGRCNENIALSSVHHVFHSEHNRLVDHIKEVLAMPDEITPQPGIDPAVLAEWQLAPGVWNGQRLFQAAKFVTEMQYQHLAFEEFARKVQPFVNEFIGYDTSIDARISAEFAHAVYRFGHSMLTETVQRFDTNTGAAHDLTLIEAFLNPPEFYADNAGGFTKTNKEAAGGILAGAVDQAGQHIDEFVVEALRNNLLGLPLDLAAINIARGRDAGLLRLNAIRAEIFALTNSNPIFAPYANWLEFGLGLNTPESLVNFIAAYGIHPTIVPTDSYPSRRAAAEALLNDNAFLMAPGATTGVDDIDLWVGGLAEKKEIFGGLLGSTMNFFFELQMENLQNGDRFYYLHRLVGLELLNALEGNSFAELIERNTTAEQLPADVFSKPSFTFDLEIIYPVPCGPVLDDPSTPWDEAFMASPAGGPVLVILPDCTIRYTDAEHALFSGWEVADDNIHSGEGDDTVRGHGGDDRLEGGGGNDGIIGGEGDDIITDTFGDDGLKGGPGHDAIHGGPGFDLLQGGTGQDFIVIGSDPGEILAGPGHDFLQGGDSFDVLIGAEGDDWFEGGGQFDEMFGDGATFVENNPLGTDGHDVMDGGGGDDGYLGEGGDDIFIHGPGVNAYDGVLGYDWVTNRAETNDAVLDLRRFEFLPPELFPFEARYDLVEGASGGAGNDEVRGTGAEDPFLFIQGDNDLNAEGIARIDGLAALLPNGATTFAGNVLLGGPGSDILEGRGLNDVLDGDAWLNVEIEDTATGNRYPTMSAVQADVFAGVVNPGNLVIRRTIEPGAPGADIDTAVFSGPLQDYDISVLGGIVFVHHRTPSPTVDQDGLPILADDGTDRLFNIELLEFADQTIPVPVASPATGFLRVTTNNGVGGGLPGQILIDGVVRDTWALDWVKMTPGTYEVCFGDVAGYGTPACESAVVTVGNTTIVTGLYEQLAIVRIDTSPAVPSTISVDGNEMDDWQVWSQFGPGDIEVCFGDVAGFDAPPCQLVTVVAGANPTIVGNFTPNGAAPVPTGFGYLRVTTDNGAGGGLPGIILIDGVERDIWALTWVKLAPGNYEVCWGAIAGYTAPLCEVASVVADQVTELNGIYIQNGFLQVTTSPATQSTIYVDGIRRDDWAVWTDLPAGEYEVCWETVGGFAPPCVTATVLPGGTTPVVGS